MYMRNTLVVYSSYSSDAGSRSESDGEDPWCNPDLSSSSSSDYDSDLSRECSYDSDEYGTTSRLEHLLLSLRITQRAITWLYDEHESAMEALEKLPVRMRTPEGLKRALADMFEAIVSGRRAKYRVSSGSTLNGTWRTTFDLNRMMIEHMAALSHDKERVSIKWAEMEAYDVRAKERARRQSESRERDAKRRAAQRKRLTLRTTHPQLASELCLSNGVLKETDLHERSNRLVYWVCPKYGPKCDCEHRWRATIISRVTSANRPHIPSKDEPYCAECPFCDETRPDTCECNSMAATHPHLAAEWHPTLNQAKTPHSADTYIITPTTTVATVAAITAWWKCSVPSCGHVWTAPIADRAKANGLDCPECHPINPLD